MTPYLRDRLLARAVLGLTLIAVLQLARIAVQGGRAGVAERERVAVESE